MKTINDFKIIDGVAVLEGVAFVLEAKVVDEFLSKNPNIARASVIAKDGRYFELKEGRLVQTKERTFPNPYFVGEKEVTEVKTKVEENIQESKPFSAGDGIEKNCCFGKSRRRTEGQK